jgi:hypothetical protein
MKESNRAVVFFRQPVQQQQLQMISWFVGRTKAEIAIKDETLLQLQDIQSDIPFCIKNECLDFSIIKQYFTRSAWNKIMDIHKDMSEKQWECSVCSQKLRLNSPLAVIAV